MKKLSDWAKENNVNYSTAYNWYKTDKLPVKAQRNEGGSIYVFDTNAAKPTTTVSSLSVPTPTTNISPSSFIPRTVSLASTGESGTRRNRSSTITRSDVYKNIEDGIIPFNNSYSGKGRGNGIDIKEVILLCQKAYYNFSAFRNIIDLMTEFSMSEIYFTGGNEKSRKFFTALMEKIDIWDIQDRFYREYFRSGNVFMERMEVTVLPKDVSKITQVYGNTLLEPSNIKLPIAYIILNPVDIQVSGNVSYINALYSKVLTPYELSSLRNPKTNEELELFNSFSPEIKEQIKNTRFSEVALPLNQEKVITVFYKKQDYEPMSIPLGYPVLKDINWKEELKNIDMAISRTVQQVVLLVTVGSELKDGSLNINQAQIDAITELFKNESVGRVLVSDFTTKAQFVIPQISDILDPKKYVVVDRDIQLGLNNILVGEDKFANQHIKVKVFVERLNHARMAFKNKFLVPEIKRISQALGFKTYPEPQFSAFSLDDKVEWARIYNRLAEVGVLTPEEALEAIESGRLPTSEESVESQQRQKQHRKNELYMPLVGGGQDKKEEGRPAGAKKKQSTKKVAPIGSPKKASEEKPELHIDVEKIKALIFNSAEVYSEVEKSLRKKYNLESLNETQSTFINSIGNLIMLNEPLNKWIESVAKYVDEPVDTNLDQVNTIRNIMNKHGLSETAAILMYHASI